MAEKPKVLVVDDEPDKRQLIAYALETSGYEVVTAENGAEGLAAVEASYPDLVITDVMMPRMDGYELARRLRDNPRTRFIPIIFQSAARQAAQDVRLGAEVGALGYITDPTDLDLLLARARTLIEFKEYLDSCEEAAFTDFLTGLANRRRFERQLEREVERTRRYGHPFCLVVIDIDSFKAINDAHGHEVGDVALRLIGKTVQAGTRGIDIGARLGGDEFAVILPETNFARGLEVAERLRAAVSSLEVPGVGGLSASFGLAEFPRTPGGARELLAAADAAMYEAKRRGPGRVGSAGDPESNPSTALGVS